MRGAIRILLRHPPLRAGPPPLPTHPCAPAVGVPASSATRAQPPAALHAMPAKRIIKKAKVRTQTFLEPYMVSVGRVWARDPHGIQHVGRQRRRACGACTTRCAGRGGGACMAACTPHLVPCLVALGCQPRLAACLAERSRALAPACPGALPTPSPAVPPHPHLPRAC